MRQNFPSTFFYCENDCSFKGKEKRTKKGKGQKERLKEENSWNSDEKYGQWKLTRGIGRKIGKRGTFLLIVENGVGGVWSSLYSDSINVIKELFVYLV